MLHDNFDLEEHKKKYVNYLEIIITRNGTMLYARPSHCKKLIELTGFSEVEIYTKMPVFVSPIKWLCEFTGSVAVWNNFYIGRLNRVQKKRLKWLQESDLYKGEIN